MFNQNGIVSRTIETTNLSYREKEALTDELHSVQQLVFNGVDRASLFLYVMSPLADQNHLSIYRDSTGKVIGYCSIQSRDLDLSCGPVRILRGVLAFVPEHRGKSLGSSFYALHVVKHSLAAWMRGRRCYMLGTPVGPLMYLALARAVTEFWPHPEQSTPPHVRALMAELAEAYHFEPPESGMPGCCHVGWALRQTPAERHALHALQKPALQYFFERNPGYQKGEGLIMIAPFHLKNLMFGLRRALRTRQRRRGSSQRAQVTSPLSTSTPKAKR